MIVINEMCMNTESGVEYVTIYTIYGEIEIGKVALTYMEDNLESRPDIK